MQSSRLYLIFLTAFLCVELRQFQCNLQFSRLYFIFLTAFLRVELKRFPRNLPDYISYSWQHSRAWSSNKLYRIFQTIPHIPDRIPARGAQTTYIESPRLYLRISACRPQTVYVQSPRLYRIYQTACLRVDLKSLVSHLLAYTSDIRQHYCAWTSNISYRIFQTLPQISVSISARGPQTIHVECPKLYFGYARACLRVDLKQCM